MKCICQWTKKSGVLEDTVRRVSDEEASEAVSTGDYIYVPKHVWKEQRDGK